MVQLPAKSDRSPTPLVTDRWVEAAWEDYLALMERSQDCKVQRYYLGDRAAQVPQGRSILEMEQAMAPDLAIEIADSSLADDLGQKRCSTKGRAFENIG
jgi:hypothetical protein